MTMTQPSAATFAAQATQFLGRPYSEMDCRQLINNMLKAVGLPGSYKGSNALFRDCGWVGTPEEAVKKFGKVPVGALLFILKFDGGEVKRGYKDGLGNADHVGVKTGTGLGAIHSSSTRKCVAESVFNDKTIPNGGWNRVGLMKQLDYGVDGTSSDTVPAAPGEAVTPDPAASYGTATTHADNSSPINLRAAPSTGAKLIDRVPQGETVTLLDGGGNGWYQVAWGKKRGYMMADFLLLTGGADWAVTLANLTLSQARALAAQYPQSLPQVFRTHG